ncbi:uncharacterized protein LOC131167414 [Malania oleifera]|uniref:uncharacterized protein LOC131167414 n=1 Tax=Malania oleifera TaxID=397392 RepID=UPI0025AE5B9F|nr:uncharacterized protein LOC131167414 [Malania oleifera]
MRKDLEGQMCSPAPNPKDVHQDVRKIKNQMEEAAPSWSQTTRHPKQAIENKPLFQPWLMESLVGLGSSLHTFVLSTQDLKPQLVRDVQVPPFINPNIQEGGIAKEMGKEQIPNEEMNHKNEVWEEQLQAMQKANMSGSSDAFNPCPMSNSILPQKLKVPNFAKFSRRQFSKSREEKTSDCSYQKREMTAQSRPMIGKGKVVYPYPCVAHFPKSTPQNSPNRAVIQEQIEDAINMGKAKCSESERSLVKWVDRKKIVSSDPSQPRPQRPLPLFSIFIPQGHPATSRPPAPASDEPATPSLTQNPIAVCHPAPSLPLCSSNSTPAQPQLWRSSLTSTERHGPASSRCSSLPLQPLESYTATTLRQAFSRPTPATHSNSTTPANDQSSSFPATTAPSSAYTRTSVLHQHQIEPEPPNTRPEHPLLR